MPTTMKDIAKEAGVTQQTVSQVLNNYKIHMVGKDTQKRIHIIAKEMNYQPNRLARSLKTGKTNIIGVIAIGGYHGYYNDPYCNEIYGGISNYLGDRKYKLIFHNYADKEGALDLVGSRTVDGIIFVLFGRRSAEELKQEISGLMSNITVPYIIIHSLTKDYGVHAVGTDCEKGGALAARHFLDHGYHREGTIGCVRREEDILGQHQQDLYNGFARALRKENVVPNEDPSLRIPSQDLEDGASLAEKLAAAGTSLPRALFVINDDVANGMIMGFNKKGIRVPHDIAVIGFNDYTIRANTINGLTSVKQPAFGKGLTAGKWLLELLDESSRDTQETLRLLEPTLTVRESCGCKKIA